MSGGRVVVSGRAGGRTVSDLGADNVVEEDPEDDVHGGEHHVAHARHDAPRADARAQQAQPAPRDRVCRPTCETHTTHTTRTTGAWVVRRRT